MLPRVNIKSNCCDYFAGCRLLLECYLLSTTEQMSDVCVCVCAAVSAAAAGMPQLSAVVGVPPVQGTLCILHRFHFSF